MEKVEPRNWSDWIAKRVAFVLAVGMSLWQLSIVYYPMPEVPLRATHLSLGLALTFLLFPTWRVRRAWTLAIDLLLVLLSASTAVYLFTQYVVIASRMGMPTGLDVTMGVLLILLVIEATRRVVGWGLTAVAILSLLYGLLGQYIPGSLGHQGLSVERTAGYLLMTSDGIYGTPIAVSASYVFIFILFGTFLQATGGADFFISIAVALFGRFRGGPAKVAVVSSALMGMISGSAAANVVTTGSISIPLMKRIGYKPHVAGAVEAVASSGGMLMPPVMGAAAFLIPQFIGGTYADVVIAAAIPAVLYFVATFFMVDLEALKTGLRGLSSSELPSFKKTFKEGWYFLLVVVLFIYFMVVLRTTPVLAAMYAIGLLSLFQLLNPRTLFQWRPLLAALERAPRDALTVINACACAGIAIGMLMVTGLGLTLSSRIVDLSGGSLPLLLILTMVISLILGMGLPTTGAYIIVAILVAPALIRVGVNPMGAHLFVFYFAIISGLTPPVALVAFVAAGVAGANPLQTAFTSTRFGLSGFLLPFLFFTGGPLLMHGSLFQVVWAFATATLGIFSLTVALQGVLLSKRLLPIWLRLILGLSAIGLIHAGLLTDAIGSACLALVLLYDYLRVRQTKNLEAGAQTPISS